MEGFVEWLHQVTDFIFAHMVLWNVLFAIVIVFFERRSPKSVWAWLLLLYFVPFLGFAFYLLLGMDLHKRKMFRIKEVEDHISEAIRQQEHQIRDSKLAEVDPHIKGYEDLVLYNLETSGAMLTDRNDVDILTEGEQKFEQLIEDMKQARRFIHIQY